MNRVSKVDLELSTFYGLKSHIGYLIAVFSHIFEWRLNVCEQVFIYM